MIGIKRSVTAAIAPILAMIAVDMGAALSVPGFHAVVGSAEAVVGRPLTPASYAGVARRTTRRVVRRTSYRIAALPPGCVYGPYYGGYYYNCAGVYYEQSGNVYIQIVIE